MKMDKPRKGQVKERYPRKLRLGLRSIETKIIAILEDYKDVLWDKLLGGQGHP